MGSYKTLLILECIIITAGCRIGTGDAILSYDYAAKKYKKQRNEKEGPEMIIKRMFNSPNYG